MDLNVTITLSDQLFELLENKLPNVGRRAEKAVAKEIGAEVRAGSRVEVKVSASPSEAQPGKPAVAVEVNKGKSVETEPETVVEAAAEAPAPAPLTAIDTRSLGVTHARAALARARKRLGCDVSGTPGYKSVTRQVKNIVAMVSEGKCEKIPDLNSEQTARFIAEMDALVLDENGNAITPEAPF